MGFLNNLFDKANKEIEIFRYNKLIEKLKNQYDILVERSKGHIFVDLDNGEAYYFWVEKLGSPSDNSKIFLIRSFDYILKNINPNELSQTNIESKLSYIYCVKDLEYYISATKSTKDIHIQILKFKNRTFRLKPAEMDWLGIYLPYNKSYHKVFGAEYINWRKNFLPNKFISVCLDFNVGNLRLRNMSNELNIEIRNWIWVKENHLFISPEVNVEYFLGSEGYNKFDQSDVKKINLDDIICYLTEGDVRYEQKTIGGGLSGGGTDLGKAITGTLMFGAVGAIINSRKDIKIEPITSETIKFDETIIRLLTNKESYNFLPKHAYILDNNSIASNYFVTCSKKETGTLEAFRTIIPEKDYQYVKLKQNNNFYKKDENIEKINELATLLKNDIITEEEFNQKKKEILSRI